MYCDDCHQPMLIWDEDGPQDDPDNYICVDCHGIEVVGGPDHHPASCREPVAAD